MRVLNYMMFMRMKVDEHDGFSLRLFMRMEVDENEGLEPWGSMKSMLNAITVCCNIPGHIGMLEYSLDNILVSR